MALFDTLLLKSSNPRMRCKAVENLSGSRHPSDTERIIASLNDESPQVRCAAVRALGKVNTPDSRRSLVRALQDGSFQVREAAARAMGRLGDLRVADALAASLRDPDAAVRIAAAEGLRAMGWKPSTPEESAWFEITLGNTPVAVSAGIASADPLVPGPNQDTSFYRRMAAEELKEKNDPVRINSMLSFLHGNDTLARISAIHDLGQINDPEITRELLTLFRDRNPEVRRVAAQALAIRDDAPPAHFLGLLQDTSFEVRLLAVQFFGRIRRPQIAEVLLPLLSDPNLQVRQATATTIGLVGNPSAIEALVVSLADQDVQMRHIAERALRQIDAAWMHSDAARNARGRLEALLSVSPPADRFVIEHVLAKLPPPAASVPEVFPSFVES
jgi:HEAT repeat protein